MAKVTQKVQSVEVKDGMLVITTPLLEKATPSSTGKADNVIPPTRMEIPHKGKVVKVQVNAYIIRPKKA